MKSIEEITQRAVQEKNIEDLNLLELHCYLSIKQLLVMYHNNQISKEQATKLKQKIYRDYNTRAKEYGLQESIYKEHLENIKKTEDLKVVLRKQLSSNTELNEIINTTIELLELYSGEKFA